jgi:hypothetical protein
MNETPTPRRPRFSLRTLLTLTAWLAMGMTIFLQWRELAPLRAEVKKLRVETGKLWIEDESKSHAIEVETDDELTWKWRVWLPAGRRYVIRSHGEQISAKSFPKEGGSMWVDGGYEQVVTYRIKKDPKNGAWKGECSLSNGAAVGADFHKWVEWNDRVMTGEGIGKQQRVFDPPQRITLIRQRYAEGNGSSESIPDPADGFIIWIEPAK